MKKIIRLTEEELKKMISESIAKKLSEDIIYINEEGHYPQFLDGFKNEIADKVADKLKNGGFRKRLYINVSRNEYTRWIKVDLEYVKVDDISDNRPYEAAYNASKTKFVSGKMVVGVLKLVVPYDEEKRTDFGLLKSRITHELNHLYDDWMNRTIQKKNGLKPRPLTHNDKVKQAYGLSNDPDFPELGDVLYRMLQTEQSAFLSTVPQDLYRLRANRDNIHSKSRRTECYKNAWFGFGRAFAVLEKCDSGYLERLNDKISAGYRKTGLPYMTDGKFNAEEYRRLLWNWCCDKYRKFIKKYDRVVQYYLDHIPEDVNEPFHHTYLPTDDEEYIMKIGEEYDRTLGINFKAL